MDFNWNPTYDAYGRPAPYSGRFPDGIANVANYVHREGLKLGIYYAVGLDIPAYNTNHPIYGTSCHMQDIAVKPLTRNNDWQGSYAIDFSASLPAHGSMLLNVQPEPGRPAPPQPTGNNISYEAEASTNTIGGYASVYNCSVCSGGKKVGYLGNGGFLQFNNVTEASAGTYTLTIYYLDGDAGRPTYLSFNGGTGVLIDFHGNGNWNSVQSMQIPVQL